MSLKNLSPNSNDNILKKEIFEIKPQKILLNIKNRTTKYKLSCLWTYMSSLPSEETRYIHYL